MAFDGFALSTGSVLFSPAANSEVDQSQCRFWFIAAATAPDASVGTTESDADCSRTRETTYTSQTCYLT